MSHPHHQQQHRPPPPPQPVGVILQANDGSLMAGVTLDGGDTYESMRALPPETADPVADRLLDGELAREHWITNVVRVQHNVAFLGAFYWAVTGAVCIVSALASAAPPSPHAPVPTWTVVLLSVFGGAIPGLFLSLVGMNLFARQVPIVVRVVVFAAMAAALTGFLAVGATTRAAVAAIQVTTALVVSHLAVALVHLRQGKRAPSNVSVSQQQQQQPPILVHPSRPRDVVPLHIGLALAIPALLAWASGLFHGNFPVQWPFFIASFVTVAVSCVHRYHWAVHYCGAQYGGDQILEALVDSYTVIVSGAVSRFVLGRSEGRSGDGGGGGGGGAAPRRTRD